MSQQSNAKHEEIEERAYRRWEERGRLLGSPDDDWFHAEREIMQRTDSPSPLCPLTIDAAAS
jgi:hypothetical protein